MAKMGMIAAVLFSMTAVSIHANASETKDESTDYEDLFYESF